MTTTGLYHNNNATSRVSPGRQDYPPHNSSSPQSPTGSVGFHMPYRREGYVEERKKFLTAKYGSDQMKLIRKRLAVENYVDTELRKLYGVSEDDTYDCEIDLDEVLDLDNDMERRRFVLDKISNCNQSTDVVNKFVEDILLQAQTL